MRLLLHMIFIWLVISNILPTIFPVGRVSALQYDDLQALQYDDLQASSPMEICKPSRCKAGGPEIKFPFSKQEQPGHCGYPGFQVSCSANGNTFINLSSYPQPLNISYISYQYYDVVSISHHCPLDVLFYPNFFLPPFFNLSLVYSPPYYSAHDSIRACLTLHDYDQSNRISYHEITKIECSRRVTGYFGTLETISCLSRGPNDYVYMAIAYMVNWATLPSTCRRGQSVFIPLDCAYSLGNEEILSYIASLQQVPLTWSLPGCFDCTFYGGACQFANTTTNTTVCKQFRTSPSPSPEQYVSDFNSNYRNDYDYGSHPAKYIILGVMLGFVVTALSSTIAYFKIQQYKKSNAEKLEKQKKVEKFLADYKSLKPTRYSYADIKRMTSHWITKLGEGGYGSVYKGELPNQTSVAVKVLKNSIDDGEDFINEVGTIGRVHHINVVRLLGFCADGVHHALVFQFMPNGSLDNFIFSKEGREKIGSWEFLQDIAISIAQGMEYLHQGCEQRILHFDIKPSNILLDHDLHPKISDFGLAKLCSKDTSLVSMSAVRGTIGYIAPEILTRNSRNVSSKSDVYSYGMLLLEMITGRKNIFEGAVGNNGQTAYYPEYLYSCLKNGQPMELGVFMAGDGNIAKKLIAVAMWCIQWFPVNRPSMKMVIRMMYGSSESLEVPPNPFVVNDDDTIAENGAHVITLDPIME